MSSISKLNSLGSVLSKSISREISKQIEASPGSWSLSSSNEGYLGGAAQCYSAVSDGSVAKIGIKGTPIVGR